MCSEKSGVASSSSSFDGASEHMWLDGRETAFYHTHDSDVDLKTEKNNFYNPFFITKFAEVRLIKADFSGQIPCIARESCSLRYLY